MSKSKLDLIEVLIKKIRDEGDIRDKENLLALIESEVQELILSIEEGAEVGTKPILRLIINRED